MFQFWSCTPQSTRLALLLALLWTLCAGLRPVYAEGPPPLPEAATDTPTPKVWPTGYVKGLYITYYGLGSETHREHVKQLLETTELNALVMDIKGDRGFIPYATQVQLVADIGANRKPMIEDWPAWMQWFKERNIYTIARLVVFKDEPLALARPEWAVTDAATGEVWRDREGLGWADPTRPEVWDYNIALAVEAAQMGFDEIQFDYVRFPSDGSVKKAAYSVEDVTEEIRVEAIAGFLAAARAALAPYPVKLAADVFGQTAWHNRDDMGIGQRIEAIAPYLDVLSPMLYPSTFADGIPKHPQYRNAIEFPFEVYNLSTQRAVDRLKAINPTLEIRPWVQDFPDYAFDRRTYTPTEIRAQMEGSRQAGGRGWMLWDPRVKFTPQALVSATPVYTPNEQGRLLVLEYHQIGEPEGRWQRTPANFRADLERLLAAGYYPVNLRDLAAGNLRMTPAGKRPIALTFDDSTSGQFRLLPNGQVNPASAVGILLNFHQAHPADWPLRATFFVLSDAGNAAQFSFGQPEWGNQKLQMLVNWGMEVGSHTLSHANLSKISPDEVQHELAGSQAALQKALPGYTVESVGVPYGAYPADDALFSGYYGDQPYGYRAAAEVSGGFALSPHAANFDPLHIPRVQATQSELDAFLRRANSPGFYYVSEGE
jgi:peptidoglycan/xylan/chitin deacetylase (PgdA/CDA1 family)